LLTVTISPGNKRDFSGTLLAALIEDLAGTVDAAYQALEEAPSTMGGEARAVRVTARPVTDSVARHMRAGELRVEVSTIHTVDLIDWTP
jgi:hypothetical protein